MNKQLSVLAGFIFFFVAGGVALNGCTHSPYVLPDSLRTNAAGICFERDVLPIFISNCTQGGCHGPNSGEGGYVLDNYADIMRKGIVPGNIAASKIWESVAITTSGDKKMPADRASLNASQLDVLKRWIIAGAVDSGDCTSICDSNNYTYSGAIAPMISTYCLGCHNSAGAQGGSLADYTSVRNAAVTGRMLGDIRHLTGYNAMPLGGIKLSDCQINQVAKWVADGAPNN